MPKHISPVNSKRCGIEKIGLLESESTIRRVWPNERIRLRSVEGKNYLPYAQAVHRKLMFKPGGYVPFSLTNKARNRAMSGQESRRGLTSGCSIC